MERQALADNGSAAERVFMKGGAAGNTKAGAAHYGVLTQTGVPVDSLALSKVDWRPGLDCDLRKRIMPLNFPRVPRIVGRHSPPRGTVTSDQRIQGDRKSWKPNTLVLVLRVGYTGV